ncbi:hypothetical protein N7G274_009276 [Stereocaulon virgatum]|uniref:Aminotransferase class V domain-containing protein n=1 Tax=Stereocaulon virgatum TaxID=373712 RepID=A0ABR3ZZ77_9LECA
MGDVDPDKTLCPFGRPMRDEHFLFAPTYTPLNHGSFGTYPRSVQKRFHEVQALSEARPDVFVRYQYPKMLDENRAAMAKFLGVPVEEVVFLPNATTAINVVLRNLKYKKGDVILHFSTIYGSVEKTIRHLIETTEMGSIILAIGYPIDDQALVSQFETAIKGAKLEGKNVRAAVFDTVSSMPGVMVPWTRLVEVCKKEGVLSMVDGAHGAGQIELGLANVQPDFFASNCHKWLYVPRGCAVFYVSRRNQHLIRTSLPTSHGFEPLPREGARAIVNPLMTAGRHRTKFETLFEFVATADVSPYLCIEEALRFRSQICGGEEKIISYCEMISNEAGRRMAETFETDVMQNSETTLTRCAMTNVRLPLNIGNGPCEIPEKDAVPVAIWMTEILAREHDVYLPTFVHACAFWIRLSGQIYLEIDDFVRGAEIVKSLCMRAKKGEYLQGGKSNESE